MKPIYFGLLVAVFLIPSLAYTQSFKIATDSTTGKRVVILEDGTVLHRHPALKEFRKGGIAVADPVAQEAEPGEWQSVFDLGRKQITASRFCMAGAVLVPLAVFYVTDDPASQPDQIAVGAGLGIVLGLIGLGLDAAGHKNYNRSIHLHLDADGVGIGIPLK